MIETYGGYWFSAYNRSVESRHDVLLESRDKFLYYVKTYSSDTGSLF